MFTLGIVGGSGSGKSTFVEYLRRLDVGEYLTLLPHDAYYRNFADMPTEVRATHNWDHPEALDNALFTQHIDALKAGQSIARPVYDFKHHKRLKKTLAVAPKPILLLDGILLFHVPEVRERIDLKVFVEAPADVRILRRLVRDVSERGRTVKSVVQQYHATVRPMHTQFVEPSKAFADVVVPWESYNTKAVALLAAGLREQLRIMKVI